MKTSFQLLSIVLGIAKLASALPAASPEEGVRLMSRAACNANSLHIIITRASTETTSGGNEGVTAIMATAIKSQIPGSTSEGIPYPASLTDYVNSETQGIISLTSVLTDYVSRCPTGKIALMGYSQGAQVTGDVLCGRASTGASDTTAISPVLTKNVVAVLKMGDPTHLKSQPGNKGSSRNDGLFARKNAAACAPYDAITNSWCDTGDQFCDSGLNVFTHLSYFSHEDEIVSFVVDQYNKLK